MGGLGITHACSVAAAASISSSLTFAARVASIGFPVPTLPQAGSLTQPRKSLPRQENMWTSVACALAQGVAEMMLSSTRNASVSDSVACAPACLHSASNGLSLQHSKSSSGPLVLCSSGDMPVPPSMRRQHPEAVRVPSETGNSGVMDIDAPFLGDIEPSVVAEIHVVPGARVMRLPSGSVAPLVVHPVS